MQRSALFRSRFRQNQRPGWEIERGESKFSGNFREWRFPLESPGDHQMNHEKQIAIEFPDDLLTQSRESAHGSSINGRDRRGDGSHHKWTSQAYLFEWLTQNPRFQ